MVTMLMPLLLTKVAISAFVLSWVWSWLSWARSAWICRKDTPNAEHQPATTVTVHAGEVVAQLMTWCELAALLGFAIPLLVPLLALAVFANKLRLEIAAHSSDDRGGLTFDGLDELRVGPAAYVLAATILTNAAIAGLFWNSELRGSLVVGIVGAVCTLACACVFFQRRRRRRWRCWRGWMRSDKARNRYGSEMEMGHSSTWAGWDWEVDGAGAGAGTGAERLLLEHEYHALEGDEEEDA